MGNIKKGKNTLNLLIDAILAEIEKRGEVIDPKKLKFLYEQVPIEVRQQVAEDSKNGVSLLGRRRT